MNRLAGPAIVFGEVLWDVLRTGSRLGGAPANFAVRLQDMGLPAALVSRVDDKELGQTTLAILNTKGVDCTHIQKDVSYPTGTVSVTTSPGGPTTYEIHTSVAYDRIDATPSALEACARAPALYFGTLALRTSHNRDTFGRLFDASPTSLKVLDINLRKNCWTPDTLRWCVERAHVLKMSEEEVPEVLQAMGVPATSLSDVSAAVFDRSNVSHCVITLGERGAIAADRNGAIAVHPGFVIDVADAIGAGDSFLAAFTLGLLEGRRLEQCVERACRVGALVASVADGMPLFMDTDYSRELPVRGGARLDVATGRDLPRSP